MEELPLTLDLLPPSFYRVFAVLLGLLWGSFLNVVIYRVPRDMSVVRPASHCPACGAPVRPWLNLPVLSYAILRGRAWCCGAKLSPRYPAVEAIGGLLSLAIVEVMVLPLAPATPLWHVAAVYVAHFALALGLVAAAFIDLEHMYIPDSITLGGTVLGLATFSFRGASFIDCAIGGVVGFLTVWLVFDRGYRLLRGQPGMGMGDAKLLMLAGAWYGWGGALVVLGLGAIQGTLCTAVLYAVRGRIDEPEAVKKEREEILAELEQMTPEERAEAEKELEKDPLFHEAAEGVGASRVAFGPFLVLATLEYMLFAGELVQTWFMPP